MDDLLDDGYDKFMQDHPQLNLMDGATNMAYRYHKPAIICLPSAPCSRMGCVKRRRLQEQQ